MQIYIIRMTDEIWFPWNFPLCLLHWLNHPWIWSYPEGIYILWHMLLSHKQSLAHKHTCRALSEDENSISLGETREDKYQSRRDVTQILSDFDTWWCFWFGVAGRRRRNKEKWKFQANEKHKKACFLWKYICTTCPIAVAQLREKRESMNQLNYHYDVQFLPRLFWSVSF